MKISNSGCVSRIFEDDIIDGTLTFPDCVTEISPLSCSFFQNLKKVVIPKNIINIKAQAFLDSENLAEVEFQGNNINIGGCCFKNAQSLKTINLPKFTKLSPGAFYNTGIKDITIPKNLKYIPENAFGKCGMLKSVSFEDGHNVEIDNYAFYDCCKLSTINNLFLKNSVIGPNAFKNCEKIKTINNLTIVEIVKSLNINGCIDELRFELNPTFDSFINFLSGNNFKIKISSKSISEVLVFSFVGGVFKYSSEDANTPLSQRKEVQSYIKSILAPAFLCHKLM